MSGYETTAHLSLDFTYREDELRTRDRRRVENLAWPRRFSLSLLKQHSGKQSLGTTRRMCGWHADFLLQVVLLQATLCALAVGSFSTAASMWHCNPGENARATLRQMP